LNPDDWKDWKEGEKGDLFHKENLRSTMLLADGGVYDNLGLERVWDRYTTVLVSDAGAPFSVIEGSLWFRFSQFFRAKRCIDIVTQQARAVRKRWLISDFENGITRGTYWGTATHIRNYELEENGYPPPLIKDSQETAALCHVRTRLNRFNDEEQERLINWGYALADAAMRRHVLKKGAKPGHLPFSKRHR
jgi:NTE family protein